VQTPTPAIVLTCRSSINRDFFTRTLVGHFLRQCPELLIFARFVSVDP